MKGTISSKGQITVPKRIRLRYDLAPGTEVEFELRDDGALLRKKKGERHPIWDAMGIGRSDWPSYFPRDVDAYIDWVRGGAYERPGKRVKRSRHKK
jgi:AbrB family looped-hinge helix DNA binding protein